MLEKSRKTKSEEDGKSDIRGFSLTELFIEGSRFLRPRSYGGAERNDEGMALKIRVERFHLFRFHICYYWSTY